MAIIFKRFRTGDSLHKAVNQQTFDTIFNVLEETIGEGCEIERNGNNGLGWKIIVPTSFGDADEDVGTARSASIEVRRDTDRNQAVFALKGFATEEQAEAGDLGEVSVLARNAADDKTALVYLGIATLVPVDTRPADEDADPTTKSIDRNDAGELALHGIGSLTPKTSFSEEERGNAALVYVDTSETPEVKYAALDAVVAADSQAENVESQSVEKSESGELRLYNFTGGGSVTPPSTLDGRSEYAVLARTGTDGPYLEYLDLNNLVLCDADERPVRLRSLTNYGGAIGLYDFATTARSSMTKTLRENSALVLRDSSGSVPKLIYATLPAAVPTDDSGTASKSLTRNTNGELALYKFTSPSGGTIDADNKDDYYVFCRGTSGTVLLQRKLDFGSTKGYTGSVTVVSDVKYSTSSHKLEYTSKTLTYENGLLKTVADNADTLIDQAVEETV